MCIRCTKLLSNTDKQTCDECIHRNGYQSVCPNCGQSYSRTNRERHYRSYRCRLTLFIEL